MVAPPTFRPISIPEAIDEFSETLHMAVMGHSLSPRTRDNYLRDLHELQTISARLYPDARLDDLTSSDIDRILVTYGSAKDQRFSTRNRSLAKMRGSGAQTRFRQSISVLMKHAERSGWIQSNPMPDSRVKPRTSPVSSARKALPVASALALAEAPTNDRERHNLAPRDMFILRLLIEAGPRVSELCATDLSDIETTESAHWIHLRATKGGRPRRMPISDETWQSLQDYLALRRALVSRLPGDSAEEEVALLLTWRGKRMTPRAVQLMVNRRMNNVRPEVRRGVTPHGLRHTAATLLLNSGAASIHTVKELLGHASIATTGVYLDAEQELLTEAVHLHPLNITHKDTRDQSSKKESSPNSPTVDLPPPVEGTKSSK
jgi:site-specific recombinase XerD